MRPNAPIRMPMTGSQKPLYRVVLLATLLLVTVSSALSQGFLVKPMSAELSAKQGNGMDIPIDVLNTAPDRKASVDISLQYLGQDENGWTATELAKASAIEKAKFPSCVPWAKIDRTSADIDPLQT